MDMAGRNLSREIYETLTARINQWIYPPGHRLTEEEISSEFDVSRSPVREALNMLVQAALIVKEERKGYSVRRIDIREINELYDTRLVLEIAVIDRICRDGMDEATLASLKERWTELLNFLPEMAAEAALEDEHFHETLAEAAGNRVISRLLKDIDCRIHFVRISDITNPERLRKTCLDHLELLSSIAERDCPRAQKVVLQNIEWGREKVSSAMQEALARAHGII
jgi:DNA-binding GntR family transcriptional regulator